MNVMYEKPVLKLTEFDSEDVITTSTIDRNNAYRALEDLSGGSNVRDVPTP